MEIDKVLGSRFIATVLPAQTVERVVEEQEVLRAAHPHARHVCFAYVGEDPRCTRFSDDGEPSKTAGFPMLRVLLGASLRETGALVVRYFGGVKLGTGGLVRAYTSAVRAAVERATLVAAEPTQRCRIRCRFAAEPNVRRVLAEHGTLIGAEYGSEGAVLEFECPSAAMGCLLNLLGARVGGDVELLSD